ncbi:MAG: transposase [Actinomycetota bacterium]
MIGPISGKRISSEIKLQIIRAVTAAKKAGVTIERSCKTIMLDPRRLRRWIAGRDRSALVEYDVIDQPPIARVCPHELTDQERSEILKAADSEELAGERHRKLTHHLSRQGRVFCSESSTLRVLRSAGKVPVYHGRSRPKRPGPDVDESEPNKAWRYDITDLPTKAGTYHLIPVMDGCSRKIMGRYFGPEKTSSSVQAVWDKSLSAEGLYAEEVEGVPTAFSDRGTQMTSKSTRQFFNDIGITQTFSRARTPGDNASCEAWMATIKCERLYLADTTEMQPFEVEEMIDRFIYFYNNERLHQGIGFVTPAERHEGRHTEIIEARKNGMQEAKRMRRIAARGGSYAAARSNEAENGALRSTERPSEKRPKGMHHEIQHQNDGGSRGDQ